MKEASKHGKSGDGPTDTQTCTCYGSELRQREEAGGGGQDQTESDGGSGLMLRFWDDVRTLGPIRHAHCLLKCSLISLDMEKL